MRMRERQHDDAAHEEERLPRCFADPCCHQRLQHGEIGGEPARQLAGAPLGEESGREMNQVREHVLAQLGDHALRRPGEQVHLDEVHDALQREREHERDRNAVEQRAIVLLERGVEQLAHDLGKCEADRRGNDEAEGRDEETT
jgi:hypothetical protein